VPSLRRRVALRVVQQALRAGGNSERFRVVHFSVQRDHVHLLVEAEGAEALARGMQGLCVRLARNLNSVFERTGSLFAERYHARSLETPTETRNALRYVLLNGNHHAAQRGAGLLWFGADPYSSAAWFEGWHDDRWRHEVPDGPQPTAVARTWLLREGWQKAGGPIRFDDTPAKSRTRR
jgi:REP element-mobilizing transposase RayT